MDPKEIKIIKLMKLIEEYWNKQGILDAAIVHFCSKKTNGFSFLDYNSGFPPDTG